MNLKIGPLTLDSNLIAAPMAGFTDYSWRILARSFGAGIVFSEMVSAEGVKRLHAKTMTYIENDDSARPFGLQLFGHNPDSFSDAVKVAGDYKFDLIDINAGCPMKKVVKKGAGSALMKSPETIAKIIKNVRLVYDGPLTIKIRSGWDENSINAVEVARRAEDSGVDAVIVHPRTRVQGFTGKADWNIIKEVKNAISIPVIGNGDVVDSKSVEKMFKETGCDGVMIGRASLGKPWLFEKIGNVEDFACHREPEGRGDPVISSDYTGLPRHSVPRNDNFTQAQLDIIRKHIELLHSREAEKYTIFMMRKFIPKYLKGIKGHKTVVREVCSAQTIREILDSLQLFEHLHNNRD